MGLDQRLADFKAEFMRTAPAGRAALYEAKIEELRASFAVEAAAGAGAIAPDFRLPNVSGNLIALSDLLSHGAVVVTFYRDGHIALADIDIDIDIDDRKRLGPQTILDALRSLPPA